MIYVNDDNGMLIEFKKSMMQALNIIEVGKMKFLLEIKVLQKSKEICTCKICDWYMEEGLNIWQQTCKKFNCLKF